MRKRFLYIGFITMLLLSLTACSRDEEAARTPDLDFYIEYASERFGVPPEEISVVQFNKATSQQYGLVRKGTFLIRPVVRLEWNGKMVCFEYASKKDYFDTSQLRDDYYYDELVEGVREYYMSNLGLDDLIVAPDGEGEYFLRKGITLCNGYSNYLSSHDVTEVNDIVIADFIEWMGDAGDLYVELRGEDPETEVKELIDTLKQAGCGLNVHAMKSLSGMSMYRMPREEIKKFYGILPLCLEGYDYSKWWYLIRPETKSLSDRDNWIEYQGYYYSPNQNDEDNNPVETDDDQAIRNKEDDDFVEMDDIEATND